MLRAELAQMIALAERLLAMDEHAVLATLFASSGSTYRPLGSMMISGLASIVAGGVSGGCLEKHVARAGRSLTQRQPAALLRFDTDPDGDAAGEGQPVLGCGGAIEVLVERLTLKHVEFLREMSAARASDMRSLAACVIEAGPSAGAAAQHVVDVHRFWLEHDSAACGMADTQLDRLLRRSITEQRSRHAVLGASGGRRALIHYLPPMTRLVILGAGDDVRPLCAIARSLDWHVTVADRRARLATRSRFPDADLVMADEWPLLLSRTTFTPRTAVVMMTHSLPDDIAILPLLSDKPMLYLGVLGPPQRREWLLNAVGERITPSDEFAARIRAPIGLNLGDRSASGIAISIAAEILAHLNGRDAQPMSATQTPAASRLPARAAHA